MRIGGVNGKRRKGKGGTPSLGKQVNKYVLPVKPLTYCNFSKLTHLRKSVE